MTDNRPTEWQWKTPVKGNTPHDGKIDGLTLQEWGQRGVDLWAKRLPDWGNGMSVSTATRFDDCARYAPATTDGLPAAWPAKMAWQWRKLERDMDERTWEAVPRWKYAGGGATPFVGHQYASLRSEWTAPGIPARLGEWWAPADQDGNPCAWPELEPLPGVVIPAAEMTPLVLHGHRALDGTWRWRYRGGDWSENDGGAELWCNEDDDEVDVVEWAPCDEHGNFCELRRVVSVAEDAIVHEAEQTAQRAMDDMRLRVQCWQGKAEEAQHGWREAARVREQQWRRAEAAERERDEWKRRAEAAERTLQEAGEKAVSGQHDWRGVARKMQNERDEAMVQVALWSGRAQRMRNDLLELAAAIHNRADKAWDGDDQ